MGPAAMLKTGLLGHCDVLWCHNVTQLKVGLLTGRFRSSVILWQRGASVGADFGLFNFKIFYRTTYKKHLNKEKKA